ncbi:MAG: hypothetical protein UHL07_07185 [Bacteroidaceae bacterium]|nr:hypothetical protein [Bacteroidaceae bacterium]
MKTYIKPETQELICKNDFLVGLSANDGKTTDDNWGREEIDMDWDEEEGW